MLTTTTGAAERGGAVPRGAGTRGHASGDGARRRRDDSHRAGAALGVDRPNASRSTVALEDEIGDARSSVECLVEYRRDAHSDARGAMTSRYQYAFSDDDGANSRAPSTRARARRSGGGHRRVARDAARDAALAYASVGVLGRLVAPIAPTPRAWRACAGCRDFASATSDESQQRLFEHYAMGLRGILASTNNLEDPSVMRRLRALRDDAPVALEHPFWGAQFLAMAFGHELGFASAQDVRTLRSIFNLAAAAAERGLVPYQAERSLRPRSAPKPRPPDLRPRRSAPVDDDEPSRGVVIAVGTLPSPVAPSEPPPRLPSRSRPKASPSFAARSGRGSRPRWRTR